VFGCGIDAATGVGFPACNGAEVDDVAAVLLFELYTV
jgi:hypothetical protein